MKNCFGKSLDFDWLTNKISCAFYAHLSAWQKLGPERVGVNPNARIGTDRTPKAVFCRLLEI